MSRRCSAALLIFAGAYILALMLLAIGTFGLFGSARDPLAGVFLLPLGLPWNLLFDAAPQWSLPWIAVGAPAVNLLALWLLCGRRRRSSGRAQRR
ncbi:MAG: hypothetical protein MUC89_04455 [Acetobacteraceae bacterium]|jgi:hypothetical protein|nr:hypothetical protein [Acetobacteraceae bacterium]